MATKKELSLRHRLFCGHCAQLGDPVEAAARAGFGRANAAKAADRLLRREDIRMEIARLRGRQREEADAVALAGLTRLAVGGVADAVRLLTLEGEADSALLADLDLINVSEIRRPKGGGLEIKFFDRLEALKLLLGHCRDQRGEDGLSFYQALEQGARAMASAGADGGSEPDAL